jgi:hypothetical protein
VVGSRTIWAEMSDYTETIEKLAERLASAKEYL